MRITQKQIREVFTALCERENISQVYSIDDEFFQLERYNPGDYTRFWRIVHSRAGSGGESPIFPVHQNRLNNAEMYHALCAIYDSNGSLKSLVNNR